MERLLKSAVGILLISNFVIVWATPIAVMGIMYKYMMKSYLVSLYEALDGNETLRNFAFTYVYSSKASVDYFAISILVLLNSTVSFSLVLHWQISNGVLPAWLIFLYYLSWVGVGGRMMGGAYALAHHEGHKRNFYQKWLRELVGNIFENWIGVLYGSAPGQFSVSHVFIHHKLNGGPGDTFYQWDLDRSSIPDFSIYVCRVFLHMIGYSSYVYLNALDNKKRADIILWGVS